MLCPVWLFRDQHTYRGVAHAMDSAVVGVEFAGAFSLLFTRCTGVNYRYQDTSGFEERSVVKECRKAQTAVLEFALKVPRQVLDVTGNFKAQMRLDPGVLAAGNALAHSLTRLLAHSCAFFTGSPTRSMSRQLTNSFSQPA